MKTYKNLHERICAFENLYSAFMKARRGKRKRPNVAAFEFNLENELIALREQLQNGTYRPGRYTHFTIYDAKPRRISAAPFRDRVVHHALVNVIDPIWERRFIHDSYACRVGRGTHAALDRATQFARQHPYVLQCDVEKFFPAIDHAILMQLLRKRIADKHTLSLCQTILDSGRNIHEAAWEMQWFPNDDLLAAGRPRGLPIGNQTSQFWGNVYLHELDKFVKHHLHCRPYLRYADDILLFASSKAQLHIWYTAIVTFLYTLRMQIPPRKRRVAPVTAGFPFLGFVIYPSHRRLQRRSGVAFARRFRGKVAAYERGTLPLTRLTGSVNGWIGHAQHGDTYGLRKAILTKQVIHGPRARSKTTSK
ncbi:MAG: reverse transcriptase domain-containing protein [Candidatus Promineifilaceae bacterium]